MFWFNTPEIITEKVKAFLQFEKDWLYGTWDFKKILLVLTVPFSFIALGLAFWKKSLWIGLAVVVLMAIGKIIWSIINAGESGKSILIPAIIGLIICFGLIFLGFKRLESNKTNR
jgi:phosphate starvation-inducible membrane PsiE